MSVEFYVISAVIAAAIIAMAARPRHRGPIMEYLLASELCDAPYESSGEPSIELICLPDGKVKLIRRGLRDITMSGAVSIAAKSDGVDVTLQERLVSGNAWDAPAREAVFHLDFLRPMHRYNIKYESQKAGLSAALPFHVRPGITSTRILSS